MQSMHVSRSRRVLDFWTCRTFFKSPKVSPASRPVFRPKHRETPRQTLLRSRRRRRLLDRFSGAPPDVSGSPKFPPLAHLTKGDAPLLLSSPRPISGDNATPRRPTSLESCRQKRMRRHQASHDKRRRQGRHALSLCRVAYPRRRYSNPLPCQSLRLLSPKTR
jgi:hypothetical protein